MIAIDAATSYNVAEKGNCNICCNCNSLNVQVVDQFQHLANLRETMAAWIQLLESYMLVGDIKA